MPKDNEVDEKVTPVAWQWLDTSNFRKNIPSAAIREHWNPLYAAATVAELRADRDSWREQAEDRLREWDKLRAEVAENEAVINVWRRRCEAAERRVGELLDVVKYAVGNPEFNSQQFVYMCKSALANSATLTGADPT